MTNILKGKPHLAVALNASSKKDSDHQLREAVIQLRVAGLPLRNLDPYQQEPTKPKTQKGLNVRLNGANYVSDKTKAAFENALQSETLDSNITNDNQTMTQSIDNRQHKLEQTQTPLNSLQGEGGHVVHQQYLKNMGEYSQQFFQLMQQQYALLTSGKHTPAILESFERGMAYFYEHQAQMQRVHEQYLKNQVEYSQSVSQVMLPSGLVTDDVATPVQMLSSSTEEPVLQVVSSMVKESAPPPITPSPEPTPVVEPISIPISTPAPVVSNEPPDSSATPATDLGPLTQSMLNVVSDKTGYPADMLEIGMDMEADLGIDSIKRVEILGAMQEQFPDLPPVDPEELAELRTLGEVIEYMGRTEKKK